jgi:hypothetical protein
LTLAHAIQFPSSRGRKVSESVIVCEVQLHLPSGMLGENTVNNPAETVQKTEGRKSLIKEFAVMFAATLVFVLPLLGKAYFGN